MLLTSGALRFSYLLRTASWTKYTFSSFSSNIFSLFSLFSCNLIPILKTNKKFPCTKITGFKRTETTPKMGLVIFFFMFSPQSSKCCRIKSQASSVGESSNSLLMGTCVAYREFLLGTSTLPPMKGCVGPQLVFYFLLVFLGSLYFHFYICARTQRYTIYTLVGRAAFYNVSDSSMQDFFGGPSGWRPRATFEVKCNAVAKEA